MMDDQFCEKNLPWTWYKSAEEKYKPQIKFSGQFNLLIATVVEDRQQCGLFGNVYEQKIHHRMSFKCTQCSISENTVADDDDGWIQDVQEVLIHIVP